MANYWILTFDISNAKSANWRYTSHRRIDSYLFVELPANRNEHSDSALGEVYRGPALPAHLCSRCMTAYVRALIPTRPLTSARLPCSPCVVIVQGGNAVDEEQGMQ